MQKQNRCNQAVSLSFPCCLSVTWFEVFSKPTFCETFAFPCCGSQVPSQHLLLQIGRGHVLQGGFHPLPPEPPLCHPVRGSLPGRPQPVCHCHPVHLWGISLLPAPRAEEVLPSSTRACSHSWEEQGISVKIHLSIGQQRGSTLENIELSLLGVQGKLIRDHQVVIVIILQYIDLLYIDYVTLFCMQNNFKCSMIYR